MQILVINKAGRSCVKTSPFIPRVGDKIDMFYEPLPEVTSVICWPSIKRLSALNVHESYDAIITIK